MEAIEALEPRSLFASVSGALVQWQPVRLDFAGPSSSESSNSPNPFRNYRLQVTFAHAASGESFNVPGFFDGDGNGGASGNVWRARFTPDQPGQWSYTASFRQGTDVAISLDAGAGSATSFNGDAGSFTVAPHDPSAPGFLGKGRLDYVGEHYFRFQDGSYFLKSETNSPENFLGYDGFDGTSAGPFGIHRYATHAADWRAGDPDWGGGDGRAIIGAVNYLADAGVTSMYFHVNTIGGDGQDTWPFAGSISRGGSSSNDNLHFDLSKLAQWDVVFAHMQRRGIQMHMVLGETEEANKRELDDATLGTERKLFYRELVARFGYHNAVQFNVCEEYDHKLDLTESRVKQFAGYIQSIDPFDHPITVMPRNDPRDRFEDFLGDSRISSTSFSLDASPVRDIDIVPGTARWGADVEDWRGYSADAGRPLPIYLDELRATDASNMAAQRKELVYPTFFSGGAGLGTIVKDRDQSIENFREFDAIWRWSGHAARFMQQNLPFWEMGPADGLLTNESSSLGGGQVLARPGEVYAIYLPAASATGRLELSGVAGVFELRWFNPRSGQFEGSTATLAGGGRRNLPGAPSSSSEDWVALVKRVVPPPPPAVVSLTLINADTDQPVAGYENLTSGTVRLNLGRLPKNLTFRANVGPSPVGSVRFGYDGNPGYRMEKNAPFALNGDDTGNFRPFKLTAGRHTLSATAIGADDGDEQGGAITLVLDVVRTSAPLPVPVGGNA